MPNHLNLNQELPKNLDQSQYLYHHEKDTPAAKLEQLKTLNLQYLLILKSYFTNTVNLDTSTTLRLGFVLIRIYTM